MNKLDLQKFAAEGNLTANAQITTKAREIDFVSSFSNSLQALIDAWGVCRPIKRQNGTKIVGKKVTGTLQNGTVTEGDIIPLSQFTVSPVEYGDITIKKYRKAVTFEAVADKGYDNAVMATDEEMKSMLRKNVLTEFFTFLQTGTIISTERNFQAAVAMAIGRVRDAFSKMGKDATGVAVFVNTIDFYKHLTVMNITTEDKFGMDYLKNYLGADILFHTSYVPEGKVLATPVNNIIPYYVDPADSEFAKMGLELVTDDVLPVLGFKTNGEYSRMQSEVVAVMGFKFIAEYLDAVAVITIDNTIYYNAPQGDGFAITSENGTSSGKTKIKLSIPKQDAKNKYYYAFGDNGYTVRPLENMKLRKDFKPWNGTDEIQVPGTQANYITVVETDPSNQALAYANAQVRKMT